MSSAPAVKVAVLGIGLLGEKAVLRLIRPQVLDTKNVCVRVCTYVYVYVGMYARVSVYVCM